MRDFLILLLLFGGVFTACHTENIVLPTNQDNFARGTVNGVAWEMENRPYARFHLDDPTTFTMWFGELPNISNEHIRTPFYFSELNVGSIGDTIYLQTVDWAASDNPPFAALDIMDVDVTSALYHCEEVVSQQKMNWIYLQLNEKGNLVGSFDITLSKESGMEQYPNEIRVQAHDYSMDYPEG